MAPFWESLKALCNKDHKTVGSILGSPMFFCMRRFQRVAKWHDAEASWTWAGALKAGMLALPLCIAGLLLRKLN